MEKRIYKNQTKLSQDEIVSLLATQTIPVSKLVISISSIVILALLVILTWDQEQLAMYILLTVLLSLGLIGTILLFVGKKWLIKISNKELANGVTYDYTFTSDGFKVESRLGEKQTQQSIRFAEVEKIVIKEDYSYIYANNVSIYFVDMHSFEEGKDEMIEVFSRYIKKKSKR
jgi:hypothetical protein